MKKISEIEIKWIKITTTIFDDEKIKLIDTMPENDALIVIWFKLLALAGKVNDGGQVYVSKKMPITDEMLAAIFNRPVSTIRLALQCFENFGMIEVEEHISIVNWEKHQNVEEMEKIRLKNAERQQKYRKNKKLRAISNEKQNVTLPLCDSNVMSHESNATERDRERDRDIERDKEKEYIGESQSDILPPSPKKTRHKYGDYEKVLLDDEQLEKLQSEFPDWQERIQRLDDYIASTGKSYKNHLATIRNWAKRDGEKQAAEAKNKKPSWNDDDYYDYEPGESL